MAAGPLDGEFLRDVKEVVFGVIPVDVMHGKALDITVHRLLQTFPQAQKVIYFFIGTYQSIKGDLFEGLQGTQDIALSKRQLPALESDPVVFS